MDELSLIFEKLSLNDKKEFNNTIKKIEENKINDMDKLCDSLDNLKLDNFQEEIKPIIKKTIINSILQISIILKNKQKCTIIQNSNFIPKYIY